jgi:HEAT repeat protein
LLADPTTVVPALIDALRDEDEVVRDLAAMSLGHYGTQARTAIPQLTKLLDDERSRYSAGEALKRIQAPDGGGSP